MYNEEEAEEFIRRRSLRRTNWRQRYDALTPDHQQAIRDAGHLNNELAETNGSLGVIFMMIAMKYKALLRGVRTIASWHLAKLRMLLLFMFFAAFGIAVEMDELQAKVIFMLYTSNWIRRPEGWSETPINRTIDALGQKARLYTRFTADQLRQLMSHLRIPAEFYLDDRRQCFTGEETLIMTLTFIATGEAMYRMLPSKFGMYNPREFGGAMKMLIRHLHDNFYHKITGDSLRMYVPWVDEYRFAIWSRLTSEATVAETRADSGVQGNEYIFHWLPFRYFRPFGFLDDLGIGTPRPVDEFGEDGRTIDVQVAFYR